MIKSNLTRVREAIPQEQKCPGTALDTKLMASKGFTLVELLVVIAIISILSTLTIGGISEIIYRSKFVKCSDNLRNLYVGLVNYEAEFKCYPRGDEFKGKNFWEALRTQPSPETALMRKQNEYFACPLKGERSGPGVCSYRGPNYPVSDSVEGVIPLGADMPENHISGKKQRAINVLYWNGKIVGAELGSEDWQELDEYLTE